MSTKHLSGYRDLSLAQFSLGINIILAKLLAPVFPIFLLLGLRFFIGFCFIALLILFSSNTHAIQELKDLTRRAWIILIIQCSCGGFLFNYLLLSGLQYTSASTTGIINSTLPALIAILSFILLKEKLTKSKTLAILLTMLGILLLGIGNLKNVNTGLHSSEMLGILLVFLAMIPGALFSVLPKLTQGALKPLTTTAFLNLLNTILFVPLAWNEWSAFSNATPIEWLQILCYGLTGGGLFFVFWYRGIRNASSNTAALFIGLLPVTTCLLAYIFLSETLSRYDMLGMVCVIASIVIGTLQQPLQFLKSMLKQFKSR